MDQFLDEKIILENFRTLQKSDARKREKSKVTS